jgi:hypothetical protein
MNFEHLLITARLTKLIVFTFITFAKICAIYSLLKAFAIFLLAERFFAVATLKMSLLFISNSKHAKV